MEGGALVTAREAGQLLGVSRDTVRRWADAGRLPIAVRTPMGAPRFRRTDVLALLQTPTSEEAS